MCQSEGYLLKMYSITCRADGWFVARVSSVRQVPAVFHPRGPARLRTVLRGAATADVHQRHEEPAAQLAGAAGACRWRSRARSLLITHVAY